MSTLTTTGSVDFVSLKVRLGMTDGNLASHIRALEALGYIVSRKQVVENRPQTIFSITNIGRQAFMDHVDALELFLRSHTLRLEAQAAEDEQKEVSW